MDAQCRIELIGGLQVQQGERRITRFQTQKTASLLAYLAFYRHQRHPREVLIEMLWPESEPSAGRHRLSMALSTLRRQLEPPGVPAGAVLQADRFHVCLNPAAVTTDVAEFLGALKTAERAQLPDERRAFLQRAMALYTGELLPGYYEAWVIAEQQRLQALYERAMEMLNRLGAPSKATLSTSPSSFEEGKSIIENRHVHLPLQFTRFFGREEEIERLLHLLASSPPRLLTLTGPGGSGKTRLAIEVGGQLGEAFPSGIWFVPLADLSDPRLIPAAILEALHLPRSPKTEPMEQTVIFLNGLVTPSLLVLDNLEHLLTNERRKAEDGAAVVRTLLERTPRLSCLVTSRQRLNLEGEREYPLLPLHTPDTEHRTREYLMQFASVQMFVERAQLVKPYFQITDGPTGNAAAVAQLCVRLEGSPLAIELAAARIQVITPAQMLSQLERRFDFLVSRKRDAIDRHRTLRAAIDWSFRLLPTDFRRLLVRLSVFRGGWTAQAAESVCEHGSVLDSLEHLLECSLVLTQESGPEMRFRMMESLREFAGEQLTSEEKSVVQHRHAAYFLALAEEAGPRLQGPDQAAWLDRLEGEHDNLRAVLASCRSGMTELDVGLRLCGALQVFWWTRGHLTEGRMWCRTLLDIEGMPERTMARAIALNGAGVLAYHQSDYAAASAYHQESLAIKRELGNERGIVASLTNLGNVSRDLGDYTAARAYYEEALAIVREIGESSAMLLNNLGNLSMFQGDYATARALIEESLSIHRKFGGQADIAAALNDLGIVAHQQGDYSSARLLYQESLAIKREIGDRWGIAVSLNNLGIVASVQRDYASAQAEFQESLTLYQEIGNRRGIANSLDNLGNIACEQGDYASARAYHEESLFIRREIGNRWGIAVSLLNLGTLACYQADYPAAQIGLQESLTISWEMEDRPCIADALEAFALLASTRVSAMVMENTTVAAEAVLRRAARLWGAAHRLREQIGVPLSAAEQEKQEREIMAAREGLDEMAWVTTWAEGQVMTLEQAVSYALEEL